MPVTQQTPSGGQRNVVAGGPKITVTVQHPAPVAKAGPAPKVVAGKVGGAAAALGGQRAAAAGRTPAPAKTAAFNPLGALLGGQGAYTTQQLGTLANNIVGPTTQAALIPLRQQAAQIQNTQATVGNRYAGYTAAENQFLGGLQQNVQGAALSNENAAAQAAQNTSNQIDTTGAAAKALNGGYLDPNVAAALQQQRQFGGTTQGAEAGFVNSQGQNETNFMQNLRATAALQGVEGQQNINSIYQKQAATNTAAQQTLIGKEQPTAKQLATTLGQQQFTDYATAKGLQLKGITAAATAQNAATNVTKANQTYSLGLGRNAIASENAGTARQKATTAAGLAASTEAYRNATVRIAQIKEQLAGATLSEKTRADLTTELASFLKIAVANAPSSATVVKNTATAVKNVTGEANWYQQAIAAGRTPQQAAGGVTQALRNDGPEATAAIQLATAPHYITPQVEAALKAIGINVPASWLKPAPVSGRVNAAATAGKPGTFNAAAGGGNGVTGKSKGG